MMWTYGIQNPSLIVHPGGCMFPDYGFAHITLEDNTVHKVLFPVGTILGYLHHVQASSVHPKKESW